MMNRRERFARVINRQERGLSGESRGGEDRASKGKVNYACYLHIAIRAR